MKSALVLCSLLALAGCSATKSAESVPAARQIPGHEDLGAFSVSLAVKDLAASRTFYEKLGFKPVAGDGKTWQILRSGTTTIGLFQGMFNHNIMTFNPGWDSAAMPLKRFKDIREIQRELKAKGLTLTTVADETTSGPASLTLTDPDGNMILLDQHVPSPPK